MGIRCLGGRFLPFVARTRVLEPAGYDRRNPGRIVRTRRRPARAAWRQAIPHPPRGSNRRLNREAKMITENLARLRAHRNNIHRYRRLLGTQLTELERRFIEGRLAEETEAFKRLSDETFP